MIRFLLLLAGLLFCGSAFADSGGQVLQFFGAVLTVASGGSGALFWWGLGLQLGGGVLGASEKRRQLRRENAERRAKYNESLSDRSVTVMRADPPWQIVYGRTIVGGFVADIFSSDKTFTQPNGESGTKLDGYKHLVIVLACHRVHDIGEVYVDGVAVGTLDVDGYPTAGDFYSTRTDTRSTILSGGSVVVNDEPTSIVQAHTGAPGAAVNVIGSVTITGTGPWTISGPVNAFVVYKVSVKLKAIRITKHLGTDTEAVDSVFAGIDPTRYTADHGLKGLAAICVTLDLEDPRFQGGPPNITADVQGALVYDPRLDSTVSGGSGAHRTNDPSTWSYSANNALCIRDFLTQRYGMRVDADEVNAARLIASANICDTSISLTVGGVTTTGAQYTCNGAFKTDQSAEAVLEDLAESMAGFVTYGADWLIIAGAWTTPVMTLTDADLAWPLELVQADTTLSNLFNGLRGQYIPQGAQTPIDFNPPYQNTAFVTADGVDLWQNVELPFTDNAARARNIARILTERNRSGQVIRYPAKLRAWPLQIGDRVTVTSTEFGLSAYTYRVTDWEFAVPGNVVLTLQRDAASIWDLADAATAEPTPNTNLPNPITVQTITGLTATSGSANAVINTDGIVMPRVKVVWDAVTDPYVLSGGHIVVYYWRIGTVRPHKLPDLDPTTTEAYISNVTEGEPLAVVVYAVNKMGFKGTIAATSHSVTTGQATLIDTPNITTGAATVFVSDAGSVSHSFTATAGFPWRVQRLLPISWTNSTGATVNVELSCEIIGTRSAGAGSVYLDAASQTSALTSADFSSLSSSLLHTDATASTKTYTHSDHLPVSNGATIYFAATVYINTTAGTTTDFAGNARLRIVAIKR